MELNEIKNRFGIIGNDPRLNSAIETAIEIAGTDLSVLITGESGVGKEVIPKIIHAHSPRKHNNYIAINCGAIPEGTIESELFGHEKGSFTGANEARKGYFEVADGGTIFLDEVGDLPLSTQVRLLRVLETGEFIRVGSSKILKTNVRVIAASNVDFERAIARGKFRKDLYYRLNAIPLFIPPLRERKGDIHLLFMKFALDCAEKYRMPTVRLTPEARAVLESYRWPGNIRQLKNIAEQISVLEREREISAEAIKSYIPSDTSTLPVCAQGSQSDSTLSDRDLIFKMLFSLREEVDTLKSIVAKLTSAEHHHHTKEIQVLPSHNNMELDTYSDIEPEEEKPVMTIQDMNADMIRNVLKKHNGKRKAAAAELGISERTLYRKIKELDIE
ncbi:MAG: sigma-54 interaction domain-containing protein [Candidatus Coprenecus sp.]